MKSAFDIGPAGFGDSETIFRLVKKFPSELVPRSMSDIVQNIDRFLVCRIRGRIVGTVSWQILPEVGAPRHPSVEIQSLAIEKKHQRKGIGAVLVKEAIRRIRRLHPSQIIALTFTPHFFRKLGFKEVPKAQLVHKIYMGCINCTKYNSPFTCPEVAMTLTP